MDRIRHRNPHTAAREALKGNDMQNDEYRETRSFSWSGWYQDLAAKVGEALAKDDKGEEGTIRMVFVDPLDRLEAYRIHGNGIAETVVQLHRSPAGNIVVFQPAIPHEVTCYATEPPTKTNPLNSDDDMASLASAIAFFASKEFLKWQGTAIQESHDIAAWRAQSAMFLVSLMQEPFCPTVSMGDDGSVKAAVGRVSAKATPGKLTITFQGPAAEYLDVLRGALRDEHRCREEARAERDADQTSMEMD